MPAFCAIWTTWGMSCSVIWFNSSSVGSPCRIGMGRPASRANRAGAPCTWKVWAICG